MYCFNYIPLKYVLKGTLTIDKNLRNPLLARAPPVLNNCKDWTKFTSHTSIQYLGGCCREIVLLLMKTNSVEGDISI